jgi:membrane-associated phospholipid phosphatase
MIGAAKRWIWIGAVVAALVLIPLSIAFVDKPIASISYSIFGRFSFLSGLAGTPSLFGPLTTGIAAILILRRAALLPIVFFDVVLAQCEISLLATKLVLSPLKAFFGRTWPLYGQPSFIVDGAYGFYLLKGGPQFAAFPSGHAASVFALCVIFWGAYPRYRIIYGGSAAAVSFMLVVGDFHFVSDVIAGCLLGGVLAALVVAAWRRIRGSLSASARWRLRRPTDKVDPLANS